jgi:hypothetical protein
MGSQTFATVPYSFTAEEAINSTKIGGNAIANTTPATGDLLKWNGTVWAPATAPTAPSFHPVAGTIPAILFGGGAVPWVFAGPFTTVTVTAGQTITANFVGVFGHGNANPQHCSFAVVYEELIGGTSPSGVRHAFQGPSYPDGYVDATPNKTALSATGIVKVITGISLGNPHQIPPGTYRIGLGLKNKSTNANFGANDFANGSVIVF